jgi:hypothetical protein
MSEDRALSFPDALVVGTSTAHTFQGAAQRSAVQGLLTFPKCRDEAAHQRLRMWPMSQVCWKCPEVPKHFGNGYCAHH